MKTVCLLMAALLSGLPPAPAPVEYALPLVLSNPMQDPEGNISHRNTSATMGPYYEPELVWEAFPEDVGELSASFQQVVRIGRISARFSCDVIQPITASTRPRWTVRFHRNCNTAWAIHHEKTVLDGHRLLPPTDPMRDGYAFEGWCYEPEGDLVCNFAAPMEGELTLYARWASAE